MIKTETEALLRMTEATLTTAELLVVRSRVPRTELERQVAIAQIGIDACRGLMTPEIRRRFPRAARIIEAGGDVAGRFEIMAPVTSCDPGSPD